ncbi:sarcosine oxidase subunit gamma [Rhodobacteraceae bacterium CCMM004]|nr:sarcosine oxidase subunit gamma [Rhodobacteraceae bacterium CCMM004]
MVRLRAESPCAGLDLPQTAGGATLSEIVPERIVSVMPFRGREGDVDTALAAAGLGWPGPGEVVGGDGAAAVWSGRGQAMVFGAEVAPDGAAVTDQSDAWAVLRLDGPDAAAVLARLVPLDLRRRSFAAPGSARTLLSHQPCLLIRRAAETWEICVFRSMAETAVHEILRAMAGVAARG